MTFAEKNRGKENCKKAVAYGLNFVQMCYGYENDLYYDYFSTECECKLKKKQIKDYEYPKSGFSKKDYYLLDTGDKCVSEKLKSDLISLGFVEENFRPIYTKKHDIILGYQLVTDITLPEIATLNDTRSIFTCDKCGSKYYEAIEFADGGFDIDGDFDDRAYKGVGYPTYISNEALEIINTHKIVKTAEYSDIIISLDLYEKLIKAYPRLECRPVITGNIKEDSEFKRVRSTAEEYRALNKDMSNGKINYFSDFISINKNNPEIIMIVYSLENCPDIKYAFYEKINDEFRCIYGSEFTEDDVDELPVEEVLLDFEPMRKEKLEVIGGLEKQKLFGSSIHKNTIPVNFKKKNLTFWYEIK